LGLPWKGARIESRSRKELRTNKASNRGRLLTLERTGGRNGNVGKARPGKKLVGGTPSAGGGDEQERIEGSFTGKPTALLGHYLRTIKKVCSNV